MPHKPGTSSLTHGPCGRPCCPQLPVPPVPLTNGADGAPLGGGPGAEPGSGNGVLPVVGQLASSFVQVRAAACCAVLRCAALRCAVLGWVACVAQYWAGLGRRETWPRGPLWPPPCAPRSTLRRVASLRAQLPASPPPHPNPRPHWPPAPAQVVGSAARGPGDVAAAVMAPPSSSAPSSGVQGVLGGLLGGLVGGAGGSAGNHLRLVAGAHMIPHVDKVDKGGEVRRLGGGWAEVVGWLGGRLQGRAGPQCIEGRSLVSGGLMSSSTTFRFAKRPLVASGGTQACKAQPVNAAGRRTHVPGADRQAADLMLRPLLRYVCERRTPTSSRAWAWAAWAWRTA